MKSVKRSEVSCIACGEIIRGKPRVMVLQLTSDDPKFTDRAKKLGFTSASWRMGDSIRAPFHRKCFDQAALIWQIAFGTRAVSPRRQ